MEKSIFSEFERLEIHDSHTIFGGHDTGTSSFIERTHGPSGLDNYADPSYDDGEKGDWSDRDAC